MPQCSSDYSIVVHYPQGHTEHLHTMACSPPCYARRWLWPVGARFRCPPASRSLWLARLRPCLRSRLNRRLWFRTVGARVWRRLCTSLWCVRSQQCGVWADPGGRQHLRHDALVCIFALDLRRRLRPCLWPARCASCSLLLGTATGHGSRSSGLSFVQAVHLACWVFLVPLACCSFSRCPRLSDHALIFDAQMFVSLR